MGARDGGRENGREGGKEGGHLLFMTRGKGGFDETDESTDRHTAGVHLLLLGLEGGRGGKMGGGRGSGGKRGRGGGREGGREGGLAWYLQCEQWKGRQWDGACG